MSNKQNLMKTGCSSPERSDLEGGKKKQDMLTKAKNKFLNLSDALKTNRILNGDLDPQKKSRAQATMEYLFKPCPNRNDKNHIFTNFRTQEPQTKRSYSLQKQNSVGAYPVKTEYSEEEEDLDTLNRLRFSTIPCDKREELRETAALALERPRKKLSFREPEILGYATKNRKKNGKRPQNNSELQSIISTQGDLAKGDSGWEDMQLENQAMRVVRTVGQAFEVCHKLSINAPDPESPDQNEQDSLIQNLVSDHVSDPVTSSLKKETSNGRDTAEENALEDTNFSDNPKSSRAAASESISIPSASNTKRDILPPGEAHSSSLNGSFLAGGNGLLSAESALSAQHEIQLLKEQLEQQTQQTQATLAQLQLLREQLAAEQSARLEAQARTHQLLIHNKELLDHITALVAHLQGTEKGPLQPHSGPHVTVPQQQQQQSAAAGDGYITERAENVSLDQNPVLHTLGLQPQGLIENRMVTSCLPSSPLRTSFNPAGSLFNFSYPPPLQDSSFESQLQRLQAFGGYSPPQYPYNYQSMMQPNFYNPHPTLVNSSYCLQPPPQSKLPSSLAAMQSYSGSPVLERRLSPTFHPDHQLHQEHTVQMSQPKQPSPSQSNSQTPPHSQMSSQSSTSPLCQRKEPQFIKPLSQLGTLTTTDVQGKVRVIVPVPSRSPDDDAGNLLASLRIGDDWRPAITRSTSEKVPNRSELMSQVSFVFVKVQDCDE